MKLYELIAILQKQDQNSNVYVPYGTNISPAVEVQIITCHFKDGKGVMICPIDSCLNEDERVDKSDKLL